MATEDNETKENVKPQTYLLNERYEINFSSPLRHLDTNGATAFEVKDNINPIRKLFALVCGQETAPRLSYLPYLKSIDAPGILKLVEYGLVTLPNKSESMVLIYNMPTGPKVSEFNSEDAKITPETFKSLSLSILSACDVLKTFGLTHRAIRPDNVFYKDSTKTELVLGDCLASFPSFHQPANIEPVEYMLCAPESRGNGTIEADIYSAGALLLSIAINTPLTSDLPIIDQIRQKIKNTSYSFLAGNEKIHSQISTVLRVLLDDQPENRCEHQTLLNFYDGRSTTLSTNDDHDRSNRALIINNEKCYTCKSAALAMLENPDFGIEVIQSGKLLEWIKTGLENEKLYAKIEKLISADKENPDKTLLLSKICIYLDYSLPLKTTNSYLFPNGLSKTIFYYKQKNQPLNPIQGLIASDNIKLWYQEQPYMRAPSNASELKIYLSRTDYGYGLDRVMYDLDEDLPCITTLLPSNFINSPSHLLKALNNFNGDYKTLPFDKSIVAYLRCKIGKKIDNLLTDLNANQDAIKISAIIRLYANIQNKNGPAQTPNLTQWLAIISKPIIQSYHNINYQKYLEQELVKLAKNGKIIELVEILENEEAINNDKKDFSEALKTANFLITEKAKILSGDSHIEDEARDLAQRFTSILAVLTMLSAFVFSLIYWVIK